MHSLKDYRDKIASVKNTKKITQAMKMVAAAKLRKAQEKAERAHPYAAGMASILSRLSASLTDNEQGPKLLKGTGRDDNHLFIIVTSDRGLCGGFNAHILRYAREQIQFLEQNGKNVQLLLIGRKGYDGLRRVFKEKIIHTHEMLDCQFDTADETTNIILQRFDRDQFDVVTLLFNEFHSILSQKPAAMQLIPFKLPQTVLKETQDTQETNTISDVIEFEPDEATILNDILPRNIAVQIYGAMLDSAAGEQAARMTAMDSATRNAGEMIDKLTLSYNRARQAHITKELIEIISGAEAV